jgi:RimJ/RimL family protein N-acetyltransferase
VREIDVFSETERLVSRRFVPADVGRPVPLRNDPEVMRFLDGGRETPRPEIGREHSEHFSGGGYQAVVERATDDLVGRLGLHPGEDRGPRGLGYELRRAAWERHEAEVRP